MILYVIWWVSWTRLDLGLWRNDWCSWGHLGRLIDLSVYRNLPVLRAAAVLYRDVMDEVCLDLNYFCNERWTLILRNSYVSCCLFWMKKSELVYLFDYPIYWWFIWELLFDGLYLSIVSKVYQCMRPFNIILLKWSDYAFNLTFFAVL